MADFDPTQFGAVAVDEPQQFDPAAHGAIPVQHDEPSILQKTGRAIADTLKGFLPQSVSEAALAPINMVPGFGQAVRPLENIAFGRPVSEGVSPLAGIPVVQRIPQIIAAEKTPALSQERFTTGAGVVADLAMLAGFKSALHPEIAAEAPLAETAGFKAPETPIAAATEPVPGVETPQPAPEVQPTAAETPPVPEVQPDTTAQPLPQTGEPNAVQEPSTGEILQRQPQEVGTTGSERVGVEPSVQGNETPEARQGTEAQPQEVARPEPEVSTFSVETPKDAFGTEQTPVANFLMSGDGVMSKSTAKRNGLYQKNPALWENAPKLHPTHGKIYPSTTTAVLDKTGKPTGKFRSVGEGGEMPDNAAQALYKEGLIADPYPDTMWNALDKESKSARSTLKSQQGQIKDIQKQAGQAKDFGQAQHDSWKQGEPVVQVKDLQVGDTVTVKGQELKVTDIDPDNFDVTLEDGKKYGVQTVKDNTVIYGEHEPIAPIQKSPKLLAGENQGDLLSSTQSEPLALVGEKGTDFGAQQAASEKATAERAQSEKGQMQLGETPPTEPPASTGVHAAAMAERLTNPPPAGEVVGWEANREQGHQWLDAGGDPQTIIQKFADTGAVTTPDMGRMSAALQRLQAARDVAEDALRKDPGNPELERTFADAYDREQRFSEAFKPMHTFASANLSSLQGKVPFNEDAARSFSGMHREFQANHEGREFTPQEAVKADNLVKKNTEAGQKYQAANEELFKTVDESLKDTPSPIRGRAPTIQELGKMFSEKLREVCDV